MTWPQDAYVGQKVVCINNKDYLIKTPNDANNLELGKIYTISKIDIICNYLCFNIEEVNQDDEFLFSFSFPSFARKEN